MKGKICSVLLAFCLLFTMIPTTAFAADVKEFTFFVCDAEEYELISGATGSVSVVRNGAVIQTHELKETTYTEEEESYIAYAFQVDVSTLEDTDWFMLTLFCDGYIPIQETLQDVEDEYVWLGDVTYWKEDCAYGLYDGDVMLEPWEPGTKAYTENYRVYGDGETALVEYYAGPWDDTLAMEALSYVDAEEEITKFRVGDLYNGRDFGVSKISGKVMAAATKSSPFMFYCFDAETASSVVFETIKATEDFGVSLSRTIGDVEKKELEAENITCNYLALNILGDAVFTGADFEIDMTDVYKDVFTISAENIKPLTTGEVGETGSANKYIYKYNEKEAFFQLMGYGVYTYLKSSEVNNGEASYILTINTNSSQVETKDVLTKSGNYIITDVDLPLNMTVPSMTTVDNISDSMTTEEVTNTVIDKIANASDGITVNVPLPKAMNIGVDAMKKAKENNTPIILAVEKTADNSFVNWSFAKIDNPVEFNPAVHVDATVEAVDTKLAAVELPSTLKITTVSFEFDGTLPGEANVTLDMKNSDLAIENTAEGTVVYLYYYNPTTNLFELQDEAAVTNGLVTFKMTHCSDYVVTSEKLPSAATTQQTPPVDNNPPAGDPPAETPPVDNNPPAGDPPTQTPPANTPSGEEKPEQTPTTYPVLEGANNEWTQGTTEGMTVRVDADFAKFSAVKVNDTVVDAKYYTAVSGSTIITLKQEYLDTLTEGTYKITIVFTDGECSTNFEIKKAVETTPDSEEDKDNTQQNTTTTPPATNGAAESPETIDNGIFYVAMFFMIGAAVVGISAFRRKQTK